MSSSSFRFSRRRLLTTAGVTGAAAAPACCGPAWPAPTAARAATPRLVLGRPAPGGAGVVPGRQVRHLLPLGRFSVPAFGNEWYPRNMYIAGSAENNHHIATYGDPSVWPYHNFINGARDKAGNFVQFAPKLTSAGGNFDPNAWAQLFADAGAKFAGPVAEHHDGFSMWNSSANEWNSVATGPRLEPDVQPARGFGKAGSWPGIRSPEAATCATPFRSRSPGMRWKRARSRWPSPPRYAGVSPSPPSSAVRCPPEAVAGSPPRHRTRRPHAAIGLAGPRQEGRHGRR